ncbi:MAG TPA: trypsin-like peptidase domain-containing protein [Candidatus Saccharimonadales bacterium]|nr:trypsin-like peptidase domain-containing protein [Candidatus Saccharimonadales bacterium]
MRGKPYKIRNLLAAAAFAGIAFVSGAGGGWLVSHDRGTADDSLSGQKKIVSSQSQVISRIAETVGSSVVSVNVSIGGSSGADDFGLFGLTRPQQSAAGTGIIVSKDVIVTNRHLVPSGTANVSVTLSDGTELKDVSVIGRTGSNDSLDVAFLKVNNTQGRDLKPASLGDSSKVQVGDRVVAIGNALGQFQNTVTSGIISGHGRDVLAGDSSGTGATENLVDLFQTDAAINSGNSGGPLVDLNGRVIGMNTAVAGNAQNIGFAIPINDVKGLIGQVVESGRFKRPYLGVRYVPLTADVAARYGLKVDEGAFVVPGGPSDPSVLPGSPAAKAGLKDGDVITAVGGTKIDRTHSLTSLIGKRKVGERVRLTVVRDARTIHISATLGAAPSS